MVLKDFLDIAYLLLAGVFFIFVLMPVIYYRRYAKQLSEIYQLFTNAGLLRKEDYEFWQGLKFFGFGFLVTIISQIRKGKNNKLHDARLLDIEASKTYLDKFDLAWIAGYYRCVRIMAVIFLALIIWALVE